MNKPTKNDESYLAKSPIFNVTILISLCILITTYLLLFHFSPKIGSNEAVYFLQAMKWANPNLYINDWSLNLSNNFGIVFSAFLYPFLSFIEDQSFATQFVRITIWVFLLFSITNLTNAMQIDLKASLLGILLFLIIQDGGLMAGAWLFGGAEQKGIAYGLSFLALSAMLNQKYIVSGAFSGLAFFTHVIVGGWSAIGLAILVLLQGRKEFIHYVYCAVPLAIITIVVAFSGIKHVNVIPFEGLDIAESLVIFRNPHHLDPYYFGNVRDGILMLGCFALLAYNCFFANTTKAIKITGYYMLIMSIVMLIGFVARVFDYFDLLIFYPFRVASVAWPLIFTIYFSDLLLRFWEEIRCNFSKKVFLKLSVAVVFILTFLAHDLRVMYWGISKIKEASTVDKGQIAIEKTYSWIKKHTPINSVILVNPCRGDFWYSAERAMVVNFKFAPVTSYYNEWYRRMYTLNGDNKFIAKGGGACKELHQNYNILGEEQLKKIQMLYNTDYYLTDWERIDLNSCLVFREYENFVYDLPRCAGNLPEK